MSEGFQPIALGSVASITMGQSPGAETYSNEENGLPFLQGCAEFGAHHPQPEIYCDPPLRVAKKDSILISVRAPVGTMNLADQDYCIGRGLGAVQGIAGKAGTSFLRYAIAQNVGFLHRRSQGSTFLAISSGELRLLPIPDIGFQTQGRIAEVLSTLDKAIEKTESLIAKYQKIKAGLMRDLFTRGVTADGKLRQPREQAPELYQETPIGWIPKEWKARSFNSIWQQVFDFRGRTPLKLGMQWGGDIPALSAMNVKMGEVDLSQETNYGLPALYRRWMTSGDLHCGDVLMTMEAPLGNISQIPDDQLYILSQRVIAIRFREADSSNDFAAWLMRSGYFQKEISRRSSGTTATGIQRAQLEQVKVAIPRLHERNLITSRLASIEAKLRQDMAELSKLRQLKTGLMYDLLSGNVRVKL